MFRDESITTTSTEWTWNEPQRGARGERHREIDRALRGIAKQRCGLDVEEARWLRAAETEGAWKKLGYLNGLEYLEDVFGCRPRTAAERLRVARELGELPQLEDALGDGELNYSVVRELTRVATPANVDRWLDRARGKNLRDVERLVAGHKKGGDPDDAPDPELITFPGCRSSRHLQVHHIEHVADGGENDPRNLTTVCDGHHGMHHDGIIGISGQAPDALLFSRDGRVLAHVPQHETDDELHVERALQTPASRALSSASPARSKYAQVEMCTLAKAAIQQAGFRAAIAKRAVEVAFAHVGTTADLTGLIREALRHCS